MKTVRLLHVVGTRPNFMKTAPVMACVDIWNRRRTSNAIRFEQRLVHTGQHYDPEMSSVFFGDLGLPQPDLYLDVRSGSHAEQTARLMVSLESVFSELTPDLVLVVGDVNSTLAAALVAAKLGIPVAHVESGLRSYDRTMPEEINRIVTDRLSRLLFTTSKSASERLVHEAAEPGWVFSVGNTMIDCLEATLPLARARNLIDPLGLVPRGFALVTLHRPSNVDDRAQLARLVDVLLRLAERVPVVFPVHARTAERLKSAGAMDRLQAAASVTILPPLGYIDFLSLLANARVVLTDSGGIQAETCVVGTPCITARTTTEWTETLKARINVLVDPYEPDTILAAVDDVLTTPIPRPTRPELWDGHASERLVAAIARWAGAAP